MPRQFWVNDECAISKECSKDFQWCPVMLNILLNNSIYEKIGQEIIKVRAFYENEKLKTFQTICSNCSRQKD